MVCVCVWFIAHRAPKMHPPRALVELHQTSILEGASWGHGGTEEGCCSN